MDCSLGMEQDCSECRMCGKGKIGNKITNYEKIKGMSVEELAEFLCEKFCHNVGENLIKEWLESECGVEY